jgi:putative flippase GtrA
MPLPPPLDQLYSRLLQALPERALALKAATFASIGVVNFTLDFCIFWFAHSRLAMPIITANVLSWGIAVSSSYVMNSLTTFAAESGRRLRLRDYATFVVSQVGGLIANTTAVFVASFFMPVLLGKVLATGASFLVNFSLSHFIVFRRREEISRH